MCIHLNVLRKDQNIKTECSQCMIKIEKLNTTWWWSIEKRKCVPTIGLYNILNHLFMHV